MKSIHHKNRREWLASGAALLSTRLLASPSPSGDGLRKAARDFAAESNFNGVILAGIGEQVLYQEAFGLSDFAAKIDMSITSVFEGGSVSKWIAALVVMRLVDGGSLTLRAPISTYLPGYRRDTGSVLTLEHLMSHASGLPNQIIPALEANLDLYKAPIDLAEAVRRYASGDLRFKPGSQWEYSHSNWLIVQQIVERVTGKSYPEIARELIFAPLKLANSGVFSGLNPPGLHVAQSYRSADRSSPPVIIGIPAFMAMIGGYYTDAADLFMLLDGVRSNRVLSQASQAELLRVRFPERRYALGGRVNTVKLGGADRIVMADTGASLGFRTLAYGLLATGETVVMLNNVSLDSDDMEATALQMLDSMVRESAP